MNGDGRMSTNNQIIVSRGSKLTLLASTSRMLAEAETVEDFIDVRNRIETIRTYVRKSYPLNR